ncbi:MAG: DUF1592 domain-containing protein [Planctomycetaceae bacterium]
MLVFWFGIAAVAVGDEMDQPGAAGVLRVVEARCVQCHGETEEPEGDVDLTALKLSRLEDDAALVRKLMHVIETREMPPEGEGPLEADLRHRTLAELKSILHVAVQKNSNSVQTPMRRMNRFQYNNAVVDLFDLNCIVFTLPERAMRGYKDYFDPASGRMPDVVTVGNRPLGKSQMIEPRLAGVAAFPQDLRAEHGFDNQADHLSLSPLLMDEFLKLGQSITDSPDFTPKQVGIWNTFFAAPENSAMLTSVERIEEIRSRLSPFLTKAFRRPVSADQLNRYTQFAAGQIDAGVEFPDAMKAVAAATLASPRFLYLYDTSHPERGAAPVEVDDFELASRLSFFFWGSIPDEALLEIAASGRLSEQDTLAAQIDRMLLDKRMKRFCDSFPSQWLQLDRLVSSVPDRNRFPDFYFSKYRLSMHMMLEPLLIFETVFVENRPITQLIDSDFTYRTAKLDQAYGPLNCASGKNSGDQVTTLTFQRLPVTDRRNGGVITNAAVMTMTSGPERTKPITRGAWIAGVVFNDPPKPPPANVPPLPEKPQAGEEHLSLRDRLAAHRERADCRGCHEQIDPLGFALENYDAVGLWRDQYENGTPVDPSGELFREDRFASVTEFKDAILRDRRRFCRAFAGHLFAFALARELAPADEVALDAITDAAADDDFRMRTLMRQIVLSQPFRTK